MSSSTNPPEATASRLLITLLLDGGHQETMSVATDDPGLGALLEQLTSPGGPLRMLQLPVREGAGMMAIRSDRIVGMVTEPPIHLEFSASPQSAGIEASRVFIRDDFLPAHRVTELLRYVNHHRQRFVETSTASTDRSYRQSEVLHEFPEIEAWFQAHLREVLAEAVRELACAPLGERIELQITAHNDGNYYRLHNDNGSPDTAARELTFVYYFHEQPRAFGGGQLKLHDSQIRDGRYLAADAYRLIEPISNRLVLFASRYLHEVTQITCPSRRFEHGRFTVNGWIHKLA